jgi:undecaprenyl-diphosphatase
VVAGAAILHLGQLVAKGITADDIAPMFVGVATSALFGYFSVVFLLRLVQRSTLYPFVWYRLFVGAGVMGLIFFTY